MHIIVFMTFDMSLEKWHTNGTLERELLLYKRMVIRGHRVTLFTYGTGSDFSCSHALNGIAVFPVYAHVWRPKNRFIRLVKSLLFPFRFRDVLKQADIYKTNQMFGAWIPVIARVLYRKKLIIRCGYEYLQDAVVNSTNVISRIFRFIPRYLLELAAYWASDIIVVTSNFSKEYITKNFLIPADSIRIQPNYVDIHRFKPRSTAGKSKGNSIIYVGRFHPIKNLCSLVMAVRDTGYRLDLIGTGPEAESLKKISAQEHVDLRFLGVISHSRLSRILPQYDVFVLPSKHENSPKALLEAMACGLAVLASNIPAVREIVRHNENGILCDLDADSLREALDVLMENARLRARLGSHARLTIEKDYTMDMIEAKEDLIYKKLCASRI